MQILSSDDFKGREAGKDSGKRAASEIERLIGNYSTLTPERQNFTFSTARENENRIGTNIILTIPGRKDDGPILVVTAHYDHLGEVGLEIFNGADDNASGAAALLAVMQTLAYKRPQNTVMLVWLDAEEHGLKGAQAFVENYAPIKGRPLVNLNLDMIAQSQTGELYMAGSSYTPALKPLMQAAAKDTGLTLRFGHDRAEDGEQDWTYLSDHSLFHRAGVPFVYLGVEDHEHYHKSTDSFETLPIEFYESSLKMVVNTVRVLDKNLDDLAKRAGPLAPQPQDMPATD